MAVTKDDLDRKIREVFSPTVLVCKVISFARLIKQ